MGVLVKEEPYTHEVGHCDRCGTILEPLVSEQWWVRMASLAAPGIAAVEGGEITFHPARYTDVYLHWMRNIRDWCISRQIWLGTRDSRVDLQQWTPFRMGRTAGALSPLRRCDADPRP